MKILAIGNSFSEDGTRYLYQIAKAAKVNMKVVNLVIGGCPLRLHYVNSVENNRAYGMHFNGMASGFKVSIREALLSDEWDVVTIQQASALSINYDTYQPYLQYMADYIRQYAPKAKLYLQETWAYEDGCKRLCETMKYNKTEDMLADVRTAYHKAEEDIKADGIIPSGEVMYELFKRGAGEIYRDGTHVSLGLGRYALGLTWFAKLTGNDIKDNSFDDLDEAVSVDEMQVAKESVRKVVFGYETE